jgi:hypothetical protein
MDEPLKAEEPKAPVEEEEPNKKASEVLFENEGDSKTAENNQNGH